MEGMPIQARNEFQQRGQRGQHQRHSQWQTLRNADLVGDCSEAIEQDFCLDDPEGESCSIGPRHGVRLESATYLDGSCSS